MGFLLAFLGAVCFSLSNVIMKKGMRTEQKDNGVFLTMVVNVCWMGLAWLVSLWIQGGARAEGKGIVLFILAGLLTTLLGRYALFAGIRSVGPSRAVAVKNAAPLFTLLFAVFVLRESIAAGPWAGIALTFIGLLMAGVCFFREEGKAGTFAGYLFALIAAMGFGFGQAVQKQGLLYYGDPFAGAFIGSAAALSPSLRWKHGRRRRRLW